MKKNCPNCGAPIDPYRIKCEYCGTMYLDLATWIEDGKPCFINYKFGDNTITTKAIPQLETVNTYDDLVYAYDHFGRSTIVESSMSCELNVKFICVVNDGALIRTVKK